MKLWIKLAMVGLIALMIFAACGKDDKEPTRATATGTTDSNGLATLTLGGYTINTTVTNDSSDGLAAIDLTAYLSDNNATIIATDPTGNNYSSMATVALAGAGKMGMPSRIQSPDEITRVALDATIIMYPAQAGLYAFESDPTGFNEFISSDQTSEQWRDGTLSEIYELYNADSTFDECVFIHLSETIYSTLHSPYRTVVCSPSEIGTFPVFSALIGSNLSIFSEDTLHFATVTYGNTVLPIIFVDNVVMNRNFWAQFTLEWDENPRDLDSHLWTPKYGADSTVYHVYYSDRGNNDTDPYADLDVDDVTSFGPEHMTIYQAYQGIYTYAVYHFSGTGTIATSGARLRLVRPDGTNQYFQVPTDVPNVGSNWWWWVCTVNGTTGEVTTINTLHEDPPYPDYAADMLQTKPEYKNEQ